MNNKIDSLTLQFIELLDQKYKDYIEDWVKHTKKNYPYKSLSLKDALDHEAYRFIADVLLDLSFEFLYSFYEYDEENYNDAREGRIFENLAHQVLSYKKNKPEMLVTEEAYEWIKNAPVSIDECIERDKKRLGIIDNKLYCSDDFVPPTQD